MGLLNLLLRIVLEESDPCNEAVVAIANHFSEHTVHIFSDESSDMVRSLEMPVVLNRSSVEQQWRIDTYVLLANNVTSFTELLRTNTFAYNRNIPWIVGLSSVTNEELRALFETFFNNGVLNVAVVLGVNSSVYIYSFFPFSANGSCYDFSPQIIDVFTSGKFVNGTNVFPKDKMDDIQNCPVSSVLFVYPPYIKFDRTGKLPLRGKAAEVFYALRKAMNFKPDFVIPPNVTTGVDFIGKVRTALGFGLPTFVPGVEHGSVLMYRCITWCLPSVSNYVRGWAALTHTFTYDIWLICLATLITATFATKFLIFRPKDEPKIVSFPWWLMTWAVIAEISQPGPNATRLRIFVVSLSIGFVIINTVFKARLHALVNGKPVPMKMTEISGVFNSSLQLFTQYGKDWLDDNVSNGSSVKDRLHQYDRSDPESLVRVRATLAEGTAAVLATADYCHSLARELNKTRDGYYSVYVLPTCVVSVRGTYFSFAIGSPFAERVRTVSNHLWEHGLSERFLTTPVEREIISAHPKPIDFVDMRGGFWILFSGWIVCVVIFIAEICWKAKTFSWFTARLCKPAINPFESAARSK